MTKIPNNEPSRERVIETIRNSSVEALPALIVALPIDLLPQAFRVLQQEGETIKRTLIAFQSLIAPGQILAAAKGLSIAATLAILYLYPAGKPNQGRLGPLLVGLPTPVFASVLSEGSDDVIATLKESALSEALQHQLTVFTQYLDLEVKELEERIETESHLIAQLSHLDLNSEQILEKEERYSGLIASVDKLTLKTNRGLALGWMSGRSDLVTHLSAAKERLLYLTSHAIGNREDTSGLYGLLKGALNQVFTLSLEPGVAVELADETPAIEGLACFKLWTNEDYAAIGLLPGYKKTANDSNIHPLVTQNLSRIGITSLGDLRYHRLYSPAALSSFITERVGRLLPVD